MESTIEKNLFVFGDQPCSRKIILYEDGILRYQIFTAEIGIKSSSLIDESQLIPAVDTRAITKSDGTILITNDHLTYRIQISKNMIRLEDAEGRVLLSELAEDKNVRGDWLSLPTGIYMAEAGNRARVNFELDQTACFYGLGEKFLNLNRRGQRIVLWNENPYGSGSEKAYKNIPFLLSNRGFGLFLNTSTRSVWDIGHSSVFSFSIEVEEPWLDLIILLGKSLKDLLRSYTKLSGRSPLPPRWSFGLWVSPYGDYLSKGGEWKQKDFIEFAQTLRDQGIAADVIHLDPFWMGKRKGLCDFQWDKEDFPDPEHFVQDLLKLGFRICLWEHPYIEKGSPLYEEGKRRGYFLKKKNGEVYDCNLVIIPQERRNESEYRESFYAPGGVVDFTNPEAVAWYKGLHRPLIQQGVATFKTDFGEVIPEDAVFYNGKTGKEMRNYYSVLYNAAVFEVLKERDERPVLWGRSGYAGIQRYPVQWSGDPHSNFRSLISTIRGGLSYGLSGVPFWSFDMGGFKGRPSLEAYIRWMQVGLLISHSRIHGTDERMPWAYEERAIQIVKKYISLRYSLIPYIYATAYEATQTGVPVIRPLFLEFEQDPLSRQYETEYLLGSSLLVCPVLNEEGTVELYLPPGQWYEYGEATKHCGPFITHLKIELEVLPLYVRQGSLIPTAEPSAVVPEFWDPMIIYLYGKRSKDEGVLELYVPEEGDESPTLIKYFSEGDSSFLEIRGPKRKYELRFIDFAYLSKVIVDGQSIQVFPIPNLLGGKVNFETSGAEIMVIVNNTDFESGQN